MPEAGDEALENGPFWRPDKRHEHCFLLARLRSSAALSVPWFDFISAYLNAAALFGAMAVAATLIWPFCSGRCTILSIQCVGAGAFALHFLLIGSGTAAITSLIALIQLLAAATSQSRSQLWLIYSTSGIALILAIVMTWNGLPTIFAGIGSLLAAVARLQQSAARMKAGFLISAPFWVTHNFLVGSIFGLTVDVVSTTSLVVALCRIGFRAIRTNPAAMLTNPIKWTRILTRV